MSTYVYLPKYGTYVKDNKYYRFGRTSAWVTYHGNVLSDFPDHKIVPDTALILQGVEL